MAASITTEGVGSAQQRETRPDVPARGNGAETKAAIYSAAVDLFAEKGYAATSIRAIAAVVGIEPASVYNHFSSKEEILYTIILKSTEDSIALIEDYVARAGDSPAERLKAATKAHVMFHCRNHKTAHIGWADLHSLGPANFKKVAAVRDHYEDIFRRELLDGIDGGQLVSTNPTLAINGIIGIGSRAAVWFRPDGPLSDAEVGEYYGDFVLRALRR
jgi:AcrR family transcriptional regulator